MTIRLRDLLLGLRDLHLGSAPVIVHASLKSFGQVEGGAADGRERPDERFPERAGAHLHLQDDAHAADRPGKQCHHLRFRRKPEPDGRILHPQDAGRPVDGDHPGDAPQNTRRPGVRVTRSCRLPASNAEKFLEPQRLDDPLGPLGALEKQDGWVLLLGVDHTVNTSIHYAEKLAGRRQFVRWALTPRGVVECPGFPGCSAGFQAIAPEMEKFTRNVQIGEAQVQAVPLSMLFKVVITRIKKDPLALLCQQVDCERCGEIRRGIKKREQDRSGDHLTRVGRLGYSDTTHQNC